MSTLEPGTVNWRLMASAIASFSFLSTIFLLFVPLLVPPLSVPQALVYPYSLPRHWHPDLHDNESFIISSPVLSPDRTRVSTSLLNTSTKIPHKHLELNMSKQNCFCPHTIMLLPQASSHKFT